MMFDHMMMWILSYGQGKNNIDKCLKKVYIWEDIAI